MKLVDRFIKTENDLIALGLIVKHIKYFVVLIIVVLLFAGCYFTADGPYWLNGKAMNVPCVMSGGCVDPERSRDECHERNQLYGFIDSYGGCWTQAELDKKTRTCERNNGKWEVSPFKNEFEDFHYRCVKESD